MSICINENRSYKYPTCIPDNVWGIQNGLSYIFNWAYHEPLCILRWFVNDPECIVKELLVNDHSYQLEASILLFMGFISFFFINYKLSPSFN